MHILVIEDNSDIAANVGDYLADRGHVVDFAADGATGLNLAQAENFDVIVLDVTLPGIDGLEVCRRLRKDLNKTTPVLMLTARDALPQKLAGFESGADDYMTKPFALQELEARVNVLGRRGRGNVSRQLQVGDLSYNLDTLTVQRASKDITLNPIGLKLLQALMESSPSVVTRKELELRVWGEELPDSDSLRVHIHGLRALIDKPFGKALIHTRHGIGYSLSDPDAVSAKA
ncbi:DNA-binding response regulator [Ahniella affigens]|uniref:DNA-binding response regulator n=1 Tax=Ahniella affigens TaxID=2021234 RepID=A0A2P1PQH4_9GAMM|nr:response regulator transcription factor [Ahniella affigens]AVP97095.1 DNA-binding response regulator [Ahniella affigens]